MGRDQGPAVRRAEGQRGTVHAAYPAGVHQAVVYSNIKGWILYEAATEAFSEIRWGGGDFEICIWPLDEIMIQIKALKL